MSEVLKKWLETPAPAGRTVQVFIPGSTKKRTKTETEGAPAPPKLTGE